MLRRIFLAALVCGFGLQGVAFADTSPGTQDSDSEITRRVARALLENDQDVAPRIQVSTLNGVVTLDGTTFSNVQILKALSDARQVSGVVKVRNRLHVER
jgi:osmotically-inducible protein OsmY